LFDDLLFLGSNIFFLLFPFALGILNRYSAYLEKHLANPANGEQNYQKSNTKFHILFRILTVGGITASIIYFLSVILFNNKIMHAHHLTKLDFSYFVFIVIQILYSFLVGFSIFFSFLYFRFRPDYRHSFIQKLSVLLSIFILTGAVINIMMYLLLNENLLLPGLLTYTPGKSEFFLKDINVIFSIILTPLFLVYSYVYTKFSRKRTLALSRIYLGLYVLVLFGILIMSFNSSSKYFDLLGPGLSKQAIFGYATGYVGVFWIYLCALSFLSIIFSIFIYKKKDKFIGSQFAISYTLKLASLNFYSTLSLFIITLLPWILLQYYKYF
jgi:hypothetical protein